MSVALPKDTTPANDSNFNDRKTAAHPCPERCLAVAWEVRAGSRGAASTHHRHSKSYLDLYLDLLWLYVIIRRPNEIAECATKDLFNGQEDIPKNGPKRPKTGCFAQV